MRILMTIACALSLLAAPPEVAPRVDLARYMGTWYEIARYENRFQRGCGCTTATYELLPSGKVTVVNRCRTKDGELKEARGRAKVVDASTCAKLKVTFFWPFYGDYWILHLDPEYRNAMVGTPNRKYLWILNREAKMDEATYQTLSQKAQRLGFDPSRLIRSQPCEGLLAQSPN